MIEYDRFDWWSNLLSVRGTVLPRVAVRVAIFVLYTGLIVLLSDAADLAGLPDTLGLDPVAHAVLGSLLGFLIVFRMNGSNNRYWEGRSHWGTIINCSRNLVRAGAEYTDRGEELARLVTGYVICLRQMLHGRRDFSEAAVYLPAEVMRAAERFGNVPTGVASAISGWIGDRYRAGDIDSPLVRHLEDLLSKLVDAQGGCEKIQKTPLPFAYVVMIKQLVVAYLLTLPLVLFDRCGWWSPLLMGVIALGLFGMEEAAVETEDPFGLSDNCLDLETLTLTIARDTGQLAARGAARADSPPTPM